MTTSDAEIVDVLALAAPPLGGYGSSPPGGMGVTPQGFGQEGYVLDSSDVGPMPRPQPAEENFAVGVPYYLPFATPYRDSWEIFRQDPVTISQLQGMLRQDGQARALYRLVTMPILAALKTASIVPPEQYEPNGGLKSEEEGYKLPSEGEEGDDPAPAPEPQDNADAEVEFIHNLFFLPASAGGMTHTFSQFVRRLLLAVMYGFSAFEMVYWVPQHGPMKNKVTLRKLDWRPSETLTFLLDGQGEFNGWRQRTFFQGRTIDVKIPRERAFYYSCEEAERPFYGVSLFESAFYHYDKKTKLYFIVHLAAQRAAVGTRIGTMPPNPHVQDKNNFTASLRDLGMAQYIVVPSADWTVTSLDETQGGRFDWLGMINHHNSQMSKSVLAAWFDSDQGTGQSNSTLVDFGTQNDETFMMMETAIMDDMAAAINSHIVPRFIDWNFGTGKYPQFRWGTLTEEQQAAIQDIFSKLAATPPGAISRQFMLQLEKRMAKICGLDIDYAKVEREALEDDQMQRKLQRSQLQEQLEGGPLGAGTSAGTSAGSPPKAGGGGAAPGVIPYGKHVTGLSRADQDLVSLISGVLSDIVTGREDGDG